MARDNRQRDRRKAEAKQRREKRKTAAAPRAAPSPQDPSSNRYVPKIPLDPPEPQRLPPAIYLDAQGRRVKAHFGQLNAASLQVDLQALRPH